MGFKTAFCKPTCLSGYPSSRPSYTFRKSLPELPGLFRSSPEEQKMTFVREIQLTLVQALVIQIPFKKGTNYVFFCRFFPKEVQLNVQGSMWSLSLWVKHSRFLKVLDKESRYVSFELKVTGLLLVAFTTTDVLAIWNTHTTAGLPPTTGSPGFPKTVQRQSMINISLVDIYLEGSCLLLYFFVGFPKEKKLKGLTCFFMKNISKRKKQKP